ncbi:restriction endonuclease subunit S [Gordonia sp. GONU]|uniref:restriction endonuclease subunit S n=1 Tax=Gordonia sp. GONU TaxID=2972949 RepID=UPI0021ACEF0C|nr:restriction endonuclease subunit S [Gordonia sp. GONU]MCR8899421.1 restriction endonuclease subunit S [Gordonia sp. GONU]
MRWRKTSLGSVAALQRGFDLPARNRRPGRVPVVSSSGVSGWHNKAVVAGPGVVTGRYGTIGEVFFQSSGFWPLNTTLWVSDFHGNSPRFIYYLLQRVDYDAHKGKSGVPGVNRNDLHNESVLLPTSTAEQCAIADALDDASQMISTLERLIAKKQAIKQGMMQQLLTGSTRLPGFNQAWVHVTLGEIASFSKGSGLPKSALTSTGSTESVHYGELFTFYGAEITEVKSRTTPNGRVVLSEALDVLMPTSDVTPRGLAKASAIGAAGVALGGDILVIRADSERGYGPFLARAIRQNADQVLQLVRGSTVYHLYAADMRNFTIALPAVSEQQAISKVLRDVEIEIEVLHSRLEKARDIKTGMMQQLLTGRTRLPVEEDGS